MTGDTYVHRNAIDGRSQQEACRTVTLGLPRSCLSPALQREAWGTETSPRLAEPRRRAQVQGSLSWLPSRVPTHRPLQLARQGSMASALPRSSCSSGSGWLAEVA